MKITGFLESALHGGEILLSLVGSLGECAIVPDNLAAWNVARAVAVIPVRPEIGAKWVELCLRSPITQRCMQTWATTTVQATLNLRDVSKLMIPIPPKQERNIIARTLGYFDCKIQLNRRMNETLEAMARAIFKSWFVDFDPVRAKADGREPAGMDAETAALFPDSFEETELGMVPNGWKISAIGDVAKVVGGSTPSTENSRFWNGSINFATPKDLADLSSPILLDTERRITEEGLEHISSGLLPTGTVLLSSRAPIGYLAITEIPVAVNQGFIALICDGVLPNYFIIHWIRQNMDTIIGNANGTTFLEISKRNFRPIQLVVPSEFILKEFALKAEALYTQIICNQKQIRILAAIRNALLPKLLSGDLQVEDIKIGKEEI